jgi:hypothetical protein
MIPTLKNLAFRIWFATLGALLATLWLVGFTGQLSAAPTPLILFCVLLIMAFAGIGWLADRAARIQLDPLLQEAGVWERSGLSFEAEIAFFKALALLDSFLVRPRTRIRYRRALGLRMARFYAAQPEKTPLADRWIFEHLWANPADREVAEAWLNDLDTRGEWDGVNEELAVRLGEAQTDNLKLQAVLGRQYLIAARTDFAALSTYRRLLEAGGGADPELVRDLARLFLREGRADALALGIYVRAAQEPAIHDEVMRGLAAGLRWVHPSARNATLLEQARALLGERDEYTLRRMVEGFVPPLATEETQTVGRRVAKPAQQLRRLSGQSADWSRRLRHRLRKVWDHVRLLSQLPRLRRGAIWFAVLGLALAGLVLTVNTARHLTKPAEAPPPSPITAIQTPPTPFTLQVAAYLSPGHAERYVARLTAQGLEAYLVKAQSADKTWYQVRIGRFTDKDAALIFGQDLKQRGVIEDFYVANRSPT